jgi:hypothetical protein
MFQDSNREFRNVERLDENPSLLVQEVETKSIFAIANDHPLFAAKHLPFVPKSMKVVEFKGEVRFIFPREPNSPRRPTSSKNLTIGEVVFVQKEGAAIKAKVFSKNGDAAHAVRVKEANPNDFEAVEFLPTTLAPILWGDAGYTAIIWHYNRRGTRSYATIAPFAARDLGATFGRFFDEGRYEVVDVKNRQIHDFH